MTWSFVSKFGMGPGNDLIFEYLLAYILESVALAAREINVAAVIVQAWMKVFKNDTIRAIELAYCNTCILCVYV